MHSPSLITRILIIALNDADPDETYLDKHGPMLKSLIEKQLPSALVTNEVVRADLIELKHKLQQAIAEQVSIVFTIGGTGLGACDIAPEAASAVCEKFIPGLMEVIRVKYGMQKPKALLSRSIAGTANRTQIYTLPGSSRAIQEYFQEIFPLLEDIAHSLHS